MGKMPMKRSFCSIDPKLFTSLCKSALSVGLGFSLFVLSGCEKSNKAPKLQLGMAPVSASVEKRVPVVTVGELKRPRYVQVSGSVEADEDSNVASKIAGVIQDVRVDRGSVVKKGDVLVTLDPTDAKNALAEQEAAAAELLVRLGLNKADQQFKSEEQPEVKAAKAALDLADSEFKRSSELLGRSVVSRAEYDQNKSSFEAARNKYQLAVYQAAQLYQSYKSSLAKLETARQRVKDTIILAPFDGMITEKFVASGEAVISGAKVVGLVRTTPLRVVLTLPEAHVGLVKEGQEVSFGVSALPDKSFTAKVKYIGPALSSASRSLTVEAVTGNHDGMLRPGFFATARLLFPTQETVLSVPLQAVRRDADVSKVYVVKDGVAREQIVSVGDTLKDVVEVVSGLNKQDKVVADASDISDGVRIK